MFIMSSIIHPALPLGLFKHYPFYHCAPLIGHRYHSALLRFPWVCPLTCTLNSTSTPGLSYLWKSLLSFLPHPWIPCGLLKLHALSHGLSVWIYLGETGPKRCHEVLKEESQAIADSRTARGCPLFPAPLHMITMDRGERALELVRRRTRSGSPRLLWKNTGEGGPGGGQSPKYLNSCLNSSLPFPQPPKNMPVVDLFK